MQNIVILILTHLFVINVSNQAVPLPPGSHEFFMTEIVRVKRQAGYVYNTPNIPFELPTQITTVSTQAQNVDRTQAQHMFYAYPAPAVSSSVGTTTGGQTSTAIKNSGTGGYNYGQQSVEAISTQTGPTQNQNAAIVQSGSVSSGYGYNAPGNSNDGGQTINSGTVQTPSSSGSAATSTVSSSYRYDTPTLGGQVEDKSDKSSGSINTNNQQINPETSSSATGSFSSGYEYNGPASILKIQSSGTSLTETDSGASQSSGAYTSGYNPGTADSSTTGTRSSQTATSSVNSSYRYENPVSSNTGQFFKTSGSSQPIVGTVTEGYNYNNQIQFLSNIGHNNLVSQTLKNTDNTQIIMNSDVSGYNINAPNPSVSNVGQTTKISTPPQTSSSLSTATSSVSTSYRYETPRQTGSNQSFGGTLNAPKYLPPSIDASVEVNNRGSPGTATSSTGKPSGSYLPPLVSDFINPTSITASDKYIPPTRNSGIGSNVNCEGPDCAGNATSKPSALYATFPASSTSSELSPHNSSLSNNSINIKQSNPAVIQSYNSYIQPPISQPSGFVSAQPSFSYIPSTYSGSSQPTVTKPGQSYLQPQVSRDPVELRSTITQPSQSYITPTNSAANGSEATPNAQYLPQNNISTGSKGNTAISPQNNNYLPPKQGSSAQQGIVTIPAASYLPPVF